MEEGFWRRVPPLALAVIVIVAFAGGAFAGGAVSILLDDSSDAAGPAVSAGSTEAGSPATTVESVLPGVVTIVNEHPDRLDEAGNLLGAISVGSGFIIDNRGYVVTNEHVIHDAAKLSVVLSNGDQRPATLLSHDAPFTDLAVLKIAGGSLRSLRWGDSAQLALGESVIAIGTALFEFRNSVTVGVVSGLGRRWLREGVYLDDLVQTDAMLNAGNSGGPLVALDGQVVGINSIVIRTIGDVTTVTGVSFAISSRTAQPIVQTIIDKGAFPRPYFGIDHRNIDADFLATSNLRVDRGAFVVRVFSESPAAKAGIQAGDVLLRLGRADISDEVPFINALALADVNERLDIQVWRDGRVFNVTLQVQPR